jgi:hypothetical protein
MKSFIFLTLIIFQTSIHAFTLNNNVGLVFPMDEVKVNVADQSCDNLGIDTTELLSIAKDAVDDYWNKTPTSRFKMRQGSVITADARYKTGVICLPDDNSCTATGAPPVSSDILIACNNNITNFPAGTGVLAITVPNNISGDKIIGSVVLLNDTATTYLKNKSRTEKISVIAHELGHAFGLGHSPVKDSLMYYSTIDLRTNLGADDMDGITYLYPKNQSVTCGSIDLNSKNKPDQVIGLLLGIILSLVAFNSYERYLKLRPRF